MSPAKAFTTGFWIFENTQNVFYHSYLIIPLVTVCVLLFTILLLLNYRLGSLIHIFADKKIYRNISKMNDLISDTLHSQKNLLFSINILAKQVLQNNISPEEIQKSIEKITELSEMSLVRTSELLDSFRDIRYKFKNNDLLTSIEEAIKKINVPSNVKIIWEKNEYDRNLTICRCDFFHMSQVFVNIFNNAIEAIKISNREYGLIQISIAIQFQWIFIIIQDNGTGVKKQSLKKIFTPYYSDKPAASNWGLGLSYAYKVIKSHLGHLRIESKYGESTTVQIMLPKSTK
jgi:signal transduction histidine kinase